MGILPWREGLGVMDGAGTMGIPHVLKPGDAAEGEVGEGMVGRS